MPTKCRIFPLPQKCACLQLFLLFTGHRANSFALKISIVKVVTTGDRDRKKSKGKNLSSAAPPGLNGSEKFSQSTQENKQDEGPQAEDV